MDVYKQPVTDPAKVSKKGRMTLELDEDTGQYVTRQQGTGDLAKVQGIQTSVRMVKVGFYLYSWDPNSKGRILP